MTLTKRLRAGLGSKPVIEREPVVTRRRRRAAGLIVFTVVALVAGLVFVAIGAEGREVSRAQANDGGAWVVNRELGAVGHKNRATGEISSYVRVLDRPGVDVFQADDLVVAHDPVTNQLLEVDPRLVGEDLEPTQLPEFTQVFAVDGAIVVLRRDPLSVWRIEASELSTLKNLDGLVPVYATNGAGEVAVAADGTIAIVEPQASELRWIGTDGAVSEPVALDLGDEVVDMTIVDATAIVLLANGDLVVVDPGGAESIGLVRYIAWATVAPGGEPMAVLQQPSRSQDLVLLAAGSVAGATASGDLVEVDLDAEQPRAVVHGSLPGRVPVAPLVHAGCIYGVVTEPAAYGAVCNDDFWSQRLDGAGSALRLRLVNGWVWVNDVDNGVTYSSQDELLVEALNDWSAIEEALVEDEDEDDSSGTDQPDNRQETLVADPDAEGEVRDSDGFDPGEANVAPIAVDDEARTRVDRAHVVNVLANDSDANNDILLVTEAELLTGTGRVLVTPNGKEVQVTPGAGFVGTITLRYSISDGRSEPVSAIVTVTVLADEAENLAPMPVTDVAATAPGNATTIDVLANDVDPEGDAMSLVSITTETGTLRWDATGQITFTPDNTTEAGWVELPYVVRDDMGAESEGLLRVEIRDLGANQEPDARNDQATTVVGRPVSLNLLDNDSDPDGDPLIVGSQPRLLEPDDADVRMSVTTDGEFVFSAEVPGTYLLSYTVNDAAEGGSESDTARIRIDVTPDTTNAPPVAVRDDVVIPRGETRTVYVLDNDGDTDGDVVTIVSWQASPGLLVAEFNDETGHVGFQISVSPGESRQPTFSYSISDGVNDPVSAPVVIAVADPVSQDQPPFANDDVIEARAGSTIQGINVTRNDFDPEGGPVTVVRVEGPGTRVGADGRSIDLDIADDVVSSFTVAYDIEDEAGNRAAAVLQVQLIPAGAPNRPPVARTDDARTLKGQAVFIDVLGNDTDPDNDVIVLEGINAQPANGVASVAADGSLRYEPKPEFSGTDVLRYSIVDSQGDRSIGEVFVGVADRLSLNLPPIANDDAYTLSGTPSLTQLEVLENDIDPEGDVLRVIGVASPSIGEASIDGFGRVQYSPPAELAEATTATFDYTIVDTAGNQASATVSVSLDAYSLEPEPTPTPEPDEPEADLLATELEIEPTPEPTPDEELLNVAPVAIDDPVGPVEAGTQVVVEVLANDFDPDAGNEELSIVSVGPGGTITGRNVTVQARDENFEVDYTIADRFGAEATATINVLVTDVPNEPPVATNDQAGPVKAGTEVVVEVLGNDFDPDGDREDLEIVAVGPGGTISGRTVVIQTGDENIDVEYTIADPDGAESVGLISVLVAENQAPTVAPFTASTAFETPINLDLGAQAFDLDDDDLFFICCEGIGDGAITNVSTAANSFTLTFTPNAGFAGQTGFAYTVDDQKGSQISGSVSIIVEAADNQAPETIDDTVQVPQGADVTVDLTRLSSDPDGDTVNRTLISQPGGDISVIFTGDTAIVSSVRSTPVGNAGSFTYEISDGVLSAQGTVSIEIIEGANETPVVTDSAIELAANASTTVNLATLALETDPGDSVTFTLGAGNFDPLTVSLTATSLQIEAASDGSGSTIEIPFTATDTRGAEASGVITVDVVDPTSPPPSAGDDTATTERGGGVLVDVLGNDTDPLDQGLTIEDVSASWGVAGVVGGQVQFQPGDRVGTAIVEYTIRDEANRTASAIITIETLGPPEQPAPPGASAESEQATITWTTPQANGESIAGYIITDGDGTQRTVGVQNTYTWTGLVNGDNYEFRVTAFNSLGESIPSDPSATVTPNLEPETPAPPTVAFGDEFLDVDWAEPANEGSQILGYELEIGPVSAIQPIGTDTFFQWPDLENGQEYTFRVRAENAAGFSLWSAPSAAEHPLRAPNAPLIGSAQRTGLSSSLTVDWMTPANNGDPISRYEIRISTGGSNFTNDPNATAFQWSGLTDGELVSFEVRARNRAGWGDWSLPSNQIQSCAAPDPVNNVAAVRGDRQARVTWSEPDDNGCGITGYTITSNTGVPRNVGGSNLQYDFDQLLNATTYDFTIRATNELGTSVVNAGSTSNTVTPAGPPLCAGTAALTATINAPRAVNLSWANAFIANGDTITSYQIDQGAGFVSTGSTNQNAVITGLANGTAYNFAVRAVNSVGTSVTCATSNATTWALPTPVGLTLTFDPDTDTITAAMTGGITNDGAWSDGYSLTAIQGVVTPGQVGVSNGSPNGDTFDFVIQSDGTFTFELEACNAAGCVEITETIGPLTAADPPDQMTPGLIVLSYGNGNSWAGDGPGGPIGASLGASLSPPADNGAPVESYAFEGQRTGWFGTQTVSLITSSPYTMPGGSPFSFIYWDHYPGYSDYYGSSNQGQPITWELRAAAINSEGQGEWSDWVSITPNMPPATLQASDQPTQSCNGNLGTCVVVGVDAFGFEPNQVIQLSVASATRSGSCSPGAVTDAGGGFSETFSCNFVGGGSAPNYYWVTYGGVRSNTTG